LSTARGAGSAFVLACDMSFAAIESAPFGHPQAGTGVSPGAGGIQHLARLMGRARALEVMLSAQDYDAELAERYGWINRALPAEELGNFVQSLAHRIAKFPAAGLVIIKELTNTIALAPAEDFRHDSSERKVVHADTGIQKFDFKSSPCDGAVLANQLIHARFAEQTGSVLIHVHALRTCRFFSIDEDTETHLPGRVACRAALGIVTLWWLVGGIGRPETVGSSLVLEGPIPPAAGNQTDRVVTVMLLS
jgi:hypothetical protein